LSAARKSRNEEKTVTEETNESTVTPVPKDAAPVEAKPRHGIENIDELKDMPDVQVDETVDPEQEVTDALKRKTQDGKGPDSVPPSDFESYATEGVDKPEHDDHVREVASEVLAGKWGATEEEVRKNLRDQDYNPGTIFTEVNRRLSAGAPSTLPKPDPDRVALQVLAGEWGMNEKLIKQRLHGAGHLVREVEQHMKNRIEKSDDNGNAKPEATEG
jgi:hypothetical protein